MTDHAILENGKVIPCSVEEWGKWSMNSEKKRVKLTILANSTRISTVFMGLNHEWDESLPPLWFETMIFYNNDPEEYQERCTTLQQAKKMHAKAVKIARRKDPYHNLLKL